MFIPTSGSATAIGQVTMTVNGAQVGNIRDFEIIPASGTVPQGWIEVQMSLREAALPAGTYTLDIQALSSGVAAVTGSGNVMAFTTNG